MSTVMEIEKAIEKLPTDELFELTHWISSRFSDAKKGSVPRFIAFLGSSRGARHWQGQQASQRSYRCAGHAGTAAVVRRA